MRYCFFGADGRVLTAHNDSTVTELPAGAVLVDEFQWENRFSIRLIDGEFVDDPIMEDIQTRVADFVRSVDRDVDAIYAAAIGNRSTEYVRAEAEALAFKQALYSGDIPETVDSWASAKSQTAQWAADDILSAAEAWRGAQNDIRRNRLRIKSTALDIADQVGLDSIAAEWRLFVSTIRSQLNLD